MRTRRIVFDGVRWAEGATLPGGESHVSRMNPSRIGAAETWTIAALALFFLFARDILFWSSTSPGFASADAVEAFLYDPTGGNQPLGLLVAGWMTWRRRRRIAAEIATSRGTKLRLALPLMFLAIGLRSWAAHTSAIDLQLPALALAVVAVGAALAGSAGIRILAAPAAVLLLTMPIPLAVVNWLIHPMQRSTAEGASGLLALLGIPHQTLGEQIFARGHAFYVIEGCAGLRALQALTLATIAYLELLYRSRLQLVVLAVSVPIVATAINQLRVLSIILNPVSDLAGDHTTQGIIMIIVGVVAIAAIDSLLQRFETRRKKEKEPPTPLAPTAGNDPPDGSRADEKSSRRRPLLALLFFFSAYTLAPAFTPRWAPGDTPGPRAATFPKTLENWKVVRTLKPDREFLGSIGWSDWLYRLYRSGPEELELLILADDHRRREQNVLSFKTALARPGFVVRHRRPAPLRSNARRATELELEGRAGRYLVLHWRTGTGSRAEEFLRSLLALDQSVFHRPERTLAIRLAIRLSDDPAQNRRRRAILAKTAEAVDRALVEMEFATQGASNTSRAGQESEEPASLPRVAPASIPTGGTTLE